MKQFSTIFCLVLFLCLSLGCGKRYDEDPITMNLYSVRSRLIGEWRLNKIMIDGADSSSILDVDSLKIFTGYWFKEGRNVYSDNMQVHSPDYTDKFDKLRFNFAYADKKNHIIFMITEGNWDTLVANKIIIPKGPINDFGHEINWAIHKLTLKEMHLSNISSSRKYELFFKKIHN